MQKHQEAKHVYFKKKKKNTFASENNLESMRGSLNPQGSLNLKVHLVYEILVNV